MNGNTMLKLQTQKYTTDASPSWNGYNHQGKIGIFVVLKMINDLKLDINTCRKYELELEWLEDFSIKKDDKYIAIHQVKTYNKTAPNEYKDAIWLLLAKILDLFDIKNAYLHSTRKINKVDNLKELLLGYKPPKEKLESEKKKEEISPKTNKKYWTPRQCHDYVKSSGKYDETFEKFDVYTYEDGCHYCSMDEIEGKIKKQLEIFNEYNSKTSEHLNRAYLHLLGLVDKHIRERHIDIQAGYKDQKAAINFGSIYELISANYELPSKEFIIYTLRDRFAKLTNEYIEDLLIEVIDGDIQSNETLNVQRLVNSVLELDDENFLKFCIKITPNHDVDDKDPESIFNALSTLITATHMNDGFLEILKRIRKEIDIEKYIFTKLGDMKLNTSYLPTTIIDTYHKQRFGRMAEKILTNSYDDSLLEVDVLITKNINLGNLISGKISANIPELDEEVDVQLEKYHYRISKMKKIRMVDIESAKGELDE